MASPLRRGGTIFFKVNSQQFRAKGNFSYVISVPKREAVVGADAVHGFTEKPQVPYIEGEITDGSDVDIQAFFNLTDATVTLELANGKVIVLRNAWYAGDAKGQTEEGNISARFEGMSGEEVR